MKEKKRNVQVIDWEAVESHYYATGMSFPDTAKAFGIKKNSLIQRATRKGWRTPGNALRKIEEGRKELAELQPKVVTASPSEAIHATLEKHKGEFQAGISSGLARAAEAIGGMTGAEVMASSRDIKNVVDSAKVIYNLGGETSSASVSINLLNMDASMLAGQVKVASTL
jgi:dTDP-4-amino-4,6-dideoxygalactose transaminase